jgi:hypothetical protein
MAHCVSVGLIFTTLLAATLLPEATGTFCTVYSVTILLHVSGLLVAHHQEVYIHTFLPPDDDKPASPKHINIVNE